MSDRPEQQQQRHGVGSAQCNIDSATTRIRADSRYGHASIAFSIPTNASGPPSMSLYEALAFQRARTFPLERLPRTDRDPLPFRHRGHYELHDDPSLAGSTMRQRLGQVLDEAIAVSSSNWMVQRHEHGQWRHDGGGPFVARSELVDSHPNPAALQ
jgi:hypothetical protein